VVLKEGPYKGKMIFEIPSIFHCWALENKDKLTDKAYLDWLERRRVKIENNKKSFTRQLLTWRYREYDEYFNNNKPTQTQPRGGLLLSIIGGKNA